MVYSTHTYPIHTAIPRRPFCATQDFVAQTDVDQAGIDAISIRSRDVFINLVRSATPTSHTVSSKRWNQKWSQTRLNRTKGHWARKRQTRVNKVYETKIVARVYSRVYKQLKVE